MAPRFLPRTIHDYAIPERAQDDFTAGGAELLDDIGRKMSVDRAHSEGRIPSPFSRAFVFAVNLFGKGLRPEAAAEDQRLDHGRELLQAAARATFRGLCATFALRRAAGLEIRLVQVPLSETAGAVQRVLLATSESAPRGRNHWNPVRLFTVRQSQDQLPEVLAGLSPVSALFPAARPLRRLRALFWYDAENGRWLDPTGPANGDPVLTQLSPVSRATLVRFLRAWTTQAVRSLEEQQGLDAFGLKPIETLALQRELERWRDELGGPLAAEGLVEQEPMGGSEGASAPAFLEYVCTPAAGELLSDFGFYQGRLLVTRDRIANGATRIYGRTFGAPRLAERAMRLSAQGDNLGLDLGLDPDAAAASYLVVDRLFTPRLLPVTERGFSPEWEGLVIAGKHYLYPFRPEILNLVQPHQLADAVSAEWDRKGDSVLVRLTLGTYSVTQVYSSSGTGEFVVGDQHIPLDYLDIRFFPNFDLGVAPQEQGDDRATGDADADAGGAVYKKAPAGELERRYYSRVRVNPEWDFSITPFKFDPGAGRLVSTTESAERLGPAQWHGDNTSYHPGQALIYTLEWKPAGFSVQDRGFCLLFLSAPQAQPASWDVGVDFGTSNTCITYRTESDPEPHLLPLPVLTSTLLLEPDYSAEFTGTRGVVYNEGGAAMLDFFYRMEDTDEVLTSSDFFPTQLATRHTDPQPRWKWDHEGGLIYFKNLSLADPTVWELIQRFPAPGVPRARRLGQPFQLRQDIKWENARWLQVYMQHLRRQVLLTAASKHATVRRIRFSYPKAFSLTQRDHFKQVLREVWNPSGLEDRVQILSESEAVLSYVVRGAQEYVVFDIGGGTTDLIGFSTGEPAFQTSFKLAAGKVNEYVVHSAAFRKVFLRAFLDEIAGEDFFVPGKIKAAFVEPYAQAHEGLLTTIWLGLLETAEQRDASGRRLLNILGALRRLEGALADPEVRAVKGFFLSITLLFGGLGYFAGLLVRAASEGRFDGKTFTLRDVEVLLTGNGSKLYNMIDHEEAQFRPVLQKMLLGGMASQRDTPTDAPNAAPPEVFTPESLRRVKFDGLYSLNGRPAPKITVAMGLLRPPSPGINARGVTVPLANILGEDGFVLKGASTEWTGSLVDFYRGVKEELRTFAPPAEAPRQLRHMLEILGSALPNGSNQGLAVIPRAGRDWHVPLRDELYRASGKYLRNRVMASANTLAEDVSNNRFGEDEIPAQEPLFVAEVAALLDQVREEFA